MRWACVLLEDLPLDGVIRRHQNPEAPLAIITGPAHRRVLLTVNAAASHLGLRAGMSVTAAQAVATNFSVVEHHAQRVEDDRQLLAAWAYRYSSQVSLAFDCAVVLEVGQSMTLFGPWPVFEYQLRHDLREMGFRHRIVAAPNAYAARVLANRHDGLGVDDKLLARALSQIPVESAGLSFDASHAFARMGLRKLGQLFALPRHTVTRRFPADVLEHLDNVRGDHTAPLPLFIPPAWFEQRIEFDHEIELSTALLFPIRRLTADLATYLTACDGGVLRYTLEFEHENVPATQLVIGLLAPERDAARLFDLARGRLDHTPVAAAVRAVRLIARDLPPFVPPSRDLFDARAQETLSLDQLRERLRARLGDDAVQGLATDADHRPERAWRHHSGRKDVIALADQRPGWLLEKPIPWRGRIVNVLAGPERIESGWWDSGDVRRDYYIVEVDGGAHAWVYAIAGEQGPYMLHGWFA